VTLVPQLLLVLPLGNVVLPLFLLAQCWQLLIIMLLLIAATPGASLLL
jgi:hypothetical protein